MRCNLVYITCIGSGLLIYQPFRLVRGQSLVHQVYRQAVAALEIACETPGFFGDFLLGSIEMAWQSYHECRRMPRCDDMVECSPVWLSLAGSKRKQRRGGASYSLTHRNTNSLVPKVER